MITAAELPIFFGRQGEIRRTCPLISPVAGAEICANTGFETLGGGGADIWASWLETAGTGALADEGVLVHAGAHAAKTTAGASANTEVYQNAVVVAANWYQMLFWSAGDGVNAGRFNVWDNTNATSIIATVTTNITAAVYAQVFRTFRTPTNCISVALELRCPTLNTGIAYFDDASIKALAFASLTTYLGRRTRRAGTYICTPTLAAGTQCGLLISYADNNNFVLMSHDGTNAILTKCVAGVYSSVISAAAVYVAGAALKTVVAANGTDYSLFYNGSQVGITTAITDAVFGTAVYGFSTYNGNRVGLVTTSKATV